MLPTILNLRIQIMYASKPMQVPLFFTHVPLVLVDAVHCPTGEPFVESGNEPTTQLYVAMAPIVGLVVAFDGVFGFETKTGVV